MNDRNEINQVYQKVILIDKYKLTQLANKILTENNSINEKYASLTMSDQVHLINSLVDHITEEFVEYSCQNI